MQLGQKETVDILPVDWLKGMEVSIEKHENDTECMKTTPQIRQSTFVAAHLLPPSQRTTIGVVGRGVARSLVHSIVNTPELSFLDGRGLTTAMGTCKIKGEM